MQRTHLDLFSGIGGFALAARWASVQTIGFAEIDDYASKVLAKNFPGVTNYGDVRTIPDGVSAWLVTGGFPCQPFSVAGKQRGADDDRHLWPEMARVVERVRPAWILAENVPGIIRMELDTVLSDMERLGYTAWPLVIPAVAVDAAHRRDRVWIVAHADEGNSGWRTNKSQWKTQKRTAVDRFGENVANADTSRWDGRTGQQRQGWRVESAHSSIYVPHADSAGLAQRQGVTGDDGSQQPPVVGTCRWQPEPDVGRVASRVPARVDRLRGLGNAIVPQVAYHLIRMMIETEGGRND